MLTAGTGSCAATTDGLETAPPKLTCGFAVDIAAKENNMMYLGKKRHACLRITFGSALHLFQSYLIVIL